MKLTPMTLENLQIAAKHIEKDGSDGMQTAAETTSAPVALAMMVVFLRIKEGSPNSFPTPEIDKKVAEFFPNDDPQKIDDYQNAAKIFEQQHISGLPQVAELVGEEIAFGMYVMYLRSRNSKGEYPPEPGLDEKVTAVLEGNKYLFAT